MVKNYSQCLLSLAIAITVSVESHADVVWDFTSSVVNGTVTFDDTDIASFSPGAECGYGCVTQIDFRHVNGNEWVFPSEIDSLVTFRFGETTMPDDIIVALIIAEDDTLGTSLAIFGETNGTIGVESPVDGGPFDATDGRFTVVPEVMPSLAFLSLSLAFYLRSRLRRPW